MANFMSSVLIRHLRTLQLQRPLDQGPSQPTDKTDADHGFYKPTPIDIAVVRIMLTRSVKLPPDLVDAIFDDAEYWAHSTNAIDFQAEHQDNMRIHGNSSQEDKFLLRSYPLGLTGVDGRDKLSGHPAYDTEEAKSLPQDSELEPSYFAKLAKYPTPRLLNPARKVVFRIKSKDQGWGGTPEFRGSYKGSYTWFEAGLERFSATQTCNSQCTRDRRPETPGSETPSLPVCSLRPIQPQIQAVPKEECSDADVDEEQHYKFVHPVLGQSEWEIIRNKAATRDWQEHVVSWSYLDDISPDSDEGKALDDEGRGRATGDGSFIRGLRLGDVITIWGKARFPAWVNNVENVRIEVYWAV